MLWGALEDVWTHFGRRSSAQINKNYHLESNFVQSQRVLGGLRVALGSPSKSISVTLRCSKAYKNAICSSEPSGGLSDRENIAQVPYLSTKLDIGHVAFKVDFPWILK